MSAAAYDNILTPDQRDALALRLEGQTQVEIATALGVQQPAVSKILRRAADAIETAGHARPSLRRPRLGGTRRIRQLQSREAQLITSGRVAGTSSVHGIDTAG